VELVQLIKRCDEMIEGYNALQVLKSLQNMRPILKERNICTEYTVYSIIGLWIVVAQDLDTSKVRIYIVYKDWVKKMMKNQKRN